MAGTSHETVDDRVLHPVSSLCPAFAGESKPLHIQAPPTAFARNKSDTFLVKGPWLGPLTQLRVGHNGRGPQPDWMLDWVRIKHCASGQEWVFFAHKWLYSGNNNESLLKPGEQCLAIQDKLLLCCRHQQGLHRHTDFLGFSQSASLHWRVKEQF